VFLTPRRPERGFAALSQNEPEIFAAERGCCCVVPSFLPLSFSSIRLEVIIKEERRKKEIKEERRKKLGRKKKEEE
jgi:hypothetical protein